MSITKFNGMVIATCALFSGDNDKNGLAPIILTPMAGKLPSKRVLSGTIAKNMDLVPGHSYLVSFTEAEPDDTYGRQFNFANGGRVTAMDTLAFYNAMGAGQVVEIEDVPASGTNTGNKGADATKGKENLTPVANKPA